MEVDRETKELSMRLRELMLKRGITVGRLAEIAGVSKSAMEKYLAGASSPRASTVARVCERVNVSPSWLLLGYSETDEVTEAVAFMDAVRRAMSNLLLQVLADEKAALELVNRAAGERLSRDLAEVIYTAAKAALHEFTEGKQTVAVLAPIPFGKGAN